MRDHEIEFLDRLSYETRRGEFFYTVFAVVLVSFGIVLRNL